MTALVVRDLTVVLGGRVVVVTGASGAGKSVLWKAIAGLVPRTRGVVDVARPPLVFVHQDPALLDDRDVHENLTFPARERGLKDAAARALLMAARLGVADVLRRMPAQLSPSQARRVALARALALAPSVLVVDEPTTGLDVAAAADVDDALATVVAGDAGAAAAVDGVPACALVVITHHPRTRARLARLPRARAFVVAQGQLLPEAA